MDVICTLSLEQEGSEAALVRALAEGALAAVEEEFSRDGHSFRLTVRPDPSGVEITVEFVTTLDERTVVDRVPLVSALLNLPWDKLEMERP